MLLLCITTAQSTYTIANTPTCVVDTPYMYAIEGLIINFINYVMGS